MVGQAQDSWAPRRKRRAAARRHQPVLRHGSRAERVFTALLSEPRDGVDRGRAWFYLAKLAWQRGELDRADARWTGWAT